MREAVQGLRGDTRSSSCSKSGSFDLDPGKSEDPTWFGLRFDLLLELTAGPEKPTMSVASTQCMPVFSKVGRHTLNMQHGNVLDFISKHNIQIQPHLAKQSAAHRVLRTDVRRLPSPDPSWSTARADYHIGSRRSTIHGHPREGLPGSLDHPQQHSCASSAGSCKNDRIIAGMSEQSFTPSSVLVEVSNESNSSTSKSRQKSRFVLAVMTKSVSTLARGKYSEIAPRRGTAFVRPRSATRVKVLALQAGPEHLLQQFSTQTRTKPRVSAIGHRLQTSVFPVKFEIRNRYVRNHAIINVKRRDDSSRYAPFLLHLCGKA
ncbi:hypothetical protein DFH11DRAFT_1546775 [Phellopilus nigrolimitatus]|nr:hypothetical protein DFH11DRAFT_1546775 [Phellopilus nigrolimitatus]